MIKKYVQNDLNIFSFVDKLDLELMQIFMTIKVYILNLLSQFI